MDKDKLIALEDEQTREAAKHEIERRILPFQFEVRDGAGGPEIIGHAAVFDQPADLGYFIETMKPGCFAASIQTDDIRALFNHDVNLILGRNRSGSLFLSEDTAGLAMRIVPGDRSYELDLMKSIRRGDITQASIGFETKARTIREVGDKLYRDITDVKLWDVSPVTFPAYVGTDVVMRSALQSIFKKEFRASPNDERIAAEELELLNATKRDLDRRRKMLDLVRN